MVVEPSVLVVRDYKEGPLPVPAVPQGLVQILDELLAVPHVVEGVVAAREKRVVEVPRLDEAVPGQAASRCVPAELTNGVEATQPAGLPYLRELDG